MKYVRAVPHDDGTIRAVDLYDAAVIDNRPAWGQTDDALLSHLFSNQKDEWLAAGQWFRVCDDTLLNGAVLTLDEDGLIAAFENPSAIAMPDPTLSGGRALRMDEFLKIGYGLGLADKIDEALATMPSLGLFLARHAEKAGIEYTDAISQESTTIKTAFARMKAANLITDEQIAAFIEAWAQTYPAQ